MDSGSPTKTHWTTDTEEKPEGCTSWILTMTGADHNSSWDTCFNEGGNVMIYSLFLSYLQRLSYLILSIGALTDLHTVTKQCQKHFTTTVRFMHVLTSFSHKGLIIRLSLLYISTVALAVYSPALS